MSTTTHALASVLEFPAIFKEFQHYRIENAAYGIVGLEAGLGGPARDLANQFARLGTRLGVVTLWSVVPSPHDEDVVTMLSPLSRVLIVEPAHMAGVLFERLARGLSEPWHPRLFHTAYGGAIGREDLSRAVDAMLRHDTEAMACVAGH